MPQLQLKSLAAASHEVPRSLSPACLDKKRKAGMFAAALWRPSAWVRASKEAVVIKLPVSFQVTYKGLAHEGETGTPQSPCWTRMTPPTSFSLLLLGALGIFALGHITKGQNNTLIFTEGNGIRNCSCPADIRDCDYSLANSVCSCKSVLPFAVKPTSYRGHVTIWFTDAATLGHLLKFTLVQDLKLSLCGPHTFPTKYLAICGLKRLRIRAEARHSSREQSLLIHNRRGGSSSYEGWQASVFISFLDVALFNRDSPLKSYSIDNISSLTRDFPDFSYFKMSPMPNDRSYVVTVIY